ALVLPVVGGGVHDTEIGSTRMVEQLGNVVVGERVAVRLALGVEIGALGADADEPVGRLVGERIATRHLEHVAVARESHSAVRGHRGQRVPVPEGDELDDRFEGRVEERVERRVDRGHPAKVCTNTTRRRLSTRSRAAANAFAVYVGSRAMPYSTAALVACS